MYPLSCHPRTPNTVACSDHSAMEPVGGGSRKNSRDEKGKTRRVLPRIPNDVAPVLPPTSRSSSRRSSQAQDSSLDLTNVTDLSQTSVLEAGSIIGGTHPPRRDFVSPVKLVSAEDGVDSSVTVAVRVRPLSDRYTHVEISTIGYTHSTKHVCAWIFSQSLIFC